MGIGAPWVYDRLRRITGYRENPSNALKTRCFQGVSLKINRNCARCRMKTVTICGSMKFEAEMQRIAFCLETKHNMNVLQCVYNIDGLDITPAERAALENAHYRKIELSDAVYVVDIQGYIGDQVSKEMAFAKRKGKDILFHSAYRGI